MIDIDASKKSLLFNVVGVRIFLQNRQLNMKPAGEAFSKHHLEAMVFVDNCNVILK
jgi:hypothetical protein